MSTPEDTADSSTEDDDLSWLCWCGHYQEDEFHCDHCGSEPPWGCDCCSCDQDYEDECGYGEDDYYEDVP